MREEMINFNCIFTQSIMKKYMIDYNNECHEIKVLRWFKEFFVSIEDRIYYSDVSNLIIDALDNSSNCEQVYNAIYENVILNVVEAIDSGYYKVAYDTLINCVVDLEKMYVRPMLEERLIKSLKCKK